MMDSSDDQKNQTHSSSALKFLVVDDDLQVLKSLEDNLNTCGYNVVTCTSTRDALDLINGKKHGVDVVLCDLKMAGTNGFEFLKHVCLKVPVFVMCMEEDTSAMMKVLREDACSSILKSSSPKVLRMLHQHVLKRRSKKVVTDIQKSQAGATTSKETTQMMIDSNETEPRYNDEDIHAGGKKRDNAEAMNHDAVNNNNVDNLNCAADSHKKQRLIWYTELHEKFVEEVNKIGLDNATPKKLLKAMNIAGLTTQHLSSHLQKYRQNLERAQGEETNQQQNHKNVRINVVRKKLAMNADSAIQEPAKMMLTTQNHYNAGIVAMIGVDIADQNPHDVPPTRHMSAVPLQMVKQNNDLYVGETTRDRDGLGQVNGIQNSSTDLHAQPLSTVTDVSELESSAPQGHARDFNNDDVLGKNGFGNLAGSSMESGDDSALDFSAFPTDDVDFSLLEAEHHFDLDNQEPTAETQAQFGDACSLWF